MEDMDVAVDLGPTRYDLECLQLEEGHVVGSTAVVEDEKLVLTNGPAPDPTKSEYLSPRMELIQACLNR